MKAHEKAHAIIMKLGKVISNLPVLDLGDGDSAAGLQLIDDVRKYLRETPAPMSYDEWLDIQLPAPAHPDTDTGARVTFADEVDLGDSPEVEQVNEDGSLRF